jgi:hypothetical protein
LYTASSGTRRFASSSREHRFGNPASYRGKYVQPLYAIPDREPLGMHNPIGRPAKTGRSSRSPTAQRHSTQQSRIERGFRRGIQTPSERRGIQTPSERGFRHPGGFSHPAGGFRHPGIQTPMKLSGDSDTHEIVWGDWPAQRFSDLGGALKRSLSKWTTCVRDHLMCEVERVDRRDGAAQRFARMTRPHSPSESAIEMCLYDGAPRQ